MQAATKCAIEKCQEPLFGSRSTEGGMDGVCCSAHLDLWNHSPECKRACRAIDEEHPKYRQIRATMRADFVRRVDAEARNR